MPRVTIVIPAKNEAGNIGPLVRGIHQNCQADAPEIIVVDDASTDGTAAEVAAVAAQLAGVRLLQHPRSAGQSAAVHSGVLAATAPVCATLDGDGQNPPTELPGLYAPLIAPDADPLLGLVAGQRVKRQDSWSKKIASRLANRLRVTLLNDGTRDTGCGLKAFRRDAFLALPYFNHMHRYLPALFVRDGWRVAHVDVRHQAREHGRSNYSNFGRALAGVVDLAGVVWLMRRRKTAHASEPARATPGEAQ